MDNRRLVIYISGTLILLFISASYYYSWLHTSPLVTTKFTNFCTTLSFLSIVIGFTVLILDYFKCQEDKDAEAQSNRIRECQTNWIELEKLFMNHYPYLDRLYSQIYPTYPQLRNQDLKLTAEERRKAKVLEVHVCSILFQIVENICTYGDHLHMSEWFKVWQSWFKSPIVLRQWQLMKQFFTPQTQECVYRYLLPKPPTTLTPPQVMAKPPNTPRSLKVVKQAPVDRSSLSTEESSLSTEESAIIAHKQKLKKARASKATASKASPSPNLTL